MERPRLERLAEAYELLWDECRLEAYLHRYPPVVSASEEREAIPDTGDENESSTDSDLSSTPSVIEETASKENGTTQGDDVEDSNSDEDWLASWTAAEMALFFPSLARRSRWFPDLIAQDLGFSKSPSQVDHLLTLLKRQSEQKKKSTQAKLEQDAYAPSISDRRSRRIARLPGAHEVSKEWIDLEETLATRLRKWQDIEDVECDAPEEVGQSEQPADIEAQQQRNEIDDEDKEKTDICIVRWDTQVTNALLFLRHSPECSPDTNAANFLYNVPLSAWSGESELELYCFSASLAVELFANKGLTRRKALSAYKSFSRVHPTPNTQLRKQNKSKTKTLAWRVLLRGVELGILAWVHLGGARADSLPEGCLPESANRKIKSTQVKQAVFDRAEKHHLVWLDTIKGDSRSKAAAEVLQAARDSATQRLIKSLQWDEALAINQSLTSMNLGNADPVVTAEGSQPPSASPMAVEKEKTTSVNYSFDDVDLSSYSYAERNKIRARFRARVARFGREAALAMPIEAQKVGRKRKGEELDSNATTAKKKARRENIQPQANVREDEGDADDEAGGDEEMEEVVASESPNRLLLASVKLPRFEQIGVSLETVILLLSQPTRDALKLFNVKAMKQIDQSCGKQHSDGKAYFSKSVSSETLTLLSKLLHGYLTQVVSTAIDVVKSGVNQRGDPYKLISAADVKAAILLSQSDHSIFKEGDLGMEPSAAALSLFRSDPPRLHKVDTNKRQELEAQLHGLKSFRSTSQHQENSNSITADAVISASDAFSMPILSTYTPHGTSMTTNEPVMDLPDSSEESSVYNDSEEERELQSQREQSRGVYKEAWVDGRVRDYNERREVENGRVWEHLNERDEARAARYERRLWASLGLQSKEPNRQIEEESSEAHESSDSDEEEEEEEDGEADGNVEYDSE